MAFISEMLVSKDFQRFGLAKKWGANYPLFFGLYNSFFQVFFIFIVKKPQTKDTEYNKDY
jgi:hypothetical protein